MGKYLIIIIPILLIIVYIMSTYNKLVTQREYVKNSMGNIAAQIESRWDALKSLIDATNKYSTHEAETLKEITAKRAAVKSTSSAADVQKDDNLFDQAVSKINVVAEAYPDLKASQVFNNTMNSINTYENNVRNSRMIYNDTVTKYNREILKFPSSMIAGMFGFREEEYFRNTETKAEMPQW